MTDLSKLKEYSYKKLDEQFDDLQRILDEHEDITRFFNLLTYKFYSPIEDYSQESRRNLDYAASDVLGRFVWQIWPSLDLTSLQNPYWFDGSWVEKLSSFMVNVFLDDSGFSISKNKFTNAWECDMYTDDQFLQNPDILCLAAYDVAKFWIEVETVPNGPSKLEVMKRGMISSGEVEKLINR